MKGPFSSYCSIFCHFLGLILLLIAAAGPWTFTSGKLTFSVLEEEAFCSVDMYRSWVVLYCKYSGNGCSEIPDFGSICPATKDWRNGCDSFENPEEKEACIGMREASDISLGLIIVSLVLVVSSIPLYFSRRSSEKSHVCFCLVFSLLSAIFLITICVTFFALQFSDQQNKGCVAAGGGCKGFAGSRSGTQTMFGFEAKASFTWGPFFWLLAVLSLPCLLITAIVRWYMVHQFGQYRLVE